MKTLCWSIFVCKIVWNLKHLKTKIVLVICEWLSTAHRKDTKCLKCQPTSCVLLCTTYLTYVFLVLYIIAAYYTIFVEILFEIYYDVKLDVCVLLQIKSWCETPGEDGRKGLSVRYWVCKYDIDMEGSLSLICSSSRISIRFQLCYITKKQLKPLF